MLDVVVSYHSIKLSDLFLGGNKKENNTVGQRKKEKK